MNQLAVSIRRGRVVSAAHVHFDIGKPVLRQMRFQLGERIGCRHVRHQAHVDFCHRLVRQHGLAAGTGVARDQSFDVDRRPGLQQHQGVDPILVVHPVLHTECLLHGAFRSFCGVVLDHLLLRRGQRFCLFEKAIHGRRVPVLFNQRIQCLNEMPCRRVHLRLEARMYIVRRAAAPLLPARYQFQFDHSLGAEGHLNPAIAILARLRHEDAHALLQLRHDFRIFDHFLKMRRGNFLFTLANQHEIDGQFFPSRLESHQRTQE